jgi:hypothetical protein
VITTARLSRARTPRGVDRRNVRVDMAVLHDGGVEG